MALNKDKIFKAADKHIRANRIEKAIAEYETWLKENPKDWNTVRQVGDLYHRIGRNNEATNKYALVADHYRRDGFNVRAIATNKMILRLDSQNENAMRNLAELQAEEGLLMEAKSHYQALVELYNKQGHKRSAAEVFKKLTEIDPQDVKVRYKYAEFLNKQGKPDEAAREYVGIADQFIGQGLVDEAVKILEQGRSLSTSDPALKIKLAQAHTLQGNHAESVSMLEEVRSEHPGDPALLGQLGEAYLAAGNTSEAEKAFQELLDAEPDNRENVLRVVELRLAQSRLDQALDQLTPLIDHHVSANEGEQATELLRMVLAKDEYHIRTLLKSAEAYTILKQDSARVSAYDSLCEAYQREGDIEKAAQVAEQLVELEPEISQHKDRLNFLKSKLGAPAAPAAPAAPEASRPAAQAPAPAPVSDVSAELEPEELDLDLEMEVDDGELEPELTLEEEADKVMVPASEPDLGELVELTREDEDNIKEKLTEAEVFVRYGLVDKAIAQLLDILESFRFHAESREKLIEVYRDQGMMIEASEQLTRLAQVYEKLGRADDAQTARAEAAQLAPAAAAPAPSEELAAGEELELTLSPETDSDLGDVGIELDDAAALDDLTSPTDSQYPALEDEIDVVIDDDSFEVEPEPAAPAASASGVAVSSEDVPVEIDLGEDDVALDDVPDLGDVALDDLGGDEVSLDDVELAIEDGPPLPTDASSPGTDLAASSEEIEVDLGLESDPELEAVPESDAAVEFDSASAPPAASTDDEPVAVDTELSAEDLEVQLDDDLEVELPDDLSLGDSQDEILVPDLGEASDDGSVEIDIDLPAAAEAPPEAAAPEPEPAPEAPPTSSDASDDLAFGVLEDSAVGFDTLSGAVEIPDAVLDAGAPQEVGAPVELAPEAAAPVSPPPSEAPVAEVPEAAAPAAPPPAETPPPAAADTPVAADTPAAAPSPAGAYAAELEEVDEYIALGLYEDARDTLRELLKQHPGDDSILSKVEELGFSAEQVEREDTPLPTAPPLEFVAPVTGGSEGAVPDAAPVATPAPAEPPAEPPAAEVSELESLVEPPAQEGADSFVDLAAELSEDIFGTQAAVEEEEDAPEGPLTDPGLDQIFKEFRKGVEKQLGTEDHDTRYNLGIAYKEMGLLDEAIAEFQLAAKDEVRGLECCSMLGLCFMEKGMPEIAIKWFNKGLALPGRREEEYHGLRYDLGQAHEAAGRPELALGLYMEIYKDNARFRDVSERVRELQAARK